jgi:PKD repeat protein
LTVKFDGSGSSGDIYGYVWNFGDGSAPVQVQPPASVTHTYSTVGTYTARLMVLDENWTESSNQVTVSVTRRK